MKFPRATHPIREIEDQLWLVSFLQYDLEFFDKDEGRIEPALNSFVPEKVLTMSLAPCISIVVASLVEMRQQSLVPG